MTNSDNVKKQINELPLDKQFKKNMHELINIIKKQRHSGASINMVLQTVFNLISTSKKERNAFYKRNKNLTNEYDIMCSDACKEITEKIMSINAKYRMFAFFLIKRLYVEGFPLKYITFDETQWNDVEYQGSDIQQHKHCSSIFKNKTSQKIYQIDHFIFSNDAEEILYTSDYSTKYFNSNDIYFPYELIIEEEDLKNLANYYAKTLLEQKYSK